MRPLLIGANPGLTLFDSTGDIPIAYASVWRVDWSLNGSGNAIVIWHDQQTHVVCESSGLGLWLAEQFNRNFPETKDLYWPTPNLVSAPVKLELDLNNGLHAEGGGFGIEILGPMDQRSVRISDFDLGGTPYDLSTVIFPCRRGRLHIEDAQVDGEPRVEESPRASSTAFLADAEVWCSA